MKVRISLCELPPDHTSVFVTDSNGAKYSLSLERPSGVFDLPVGAAIFVGAPELETGTLIASEHATPLTDETQPFFPF